MSKESDSSQPAEDDLEAQFLRKQAENEEPLTVPLVIYIGEERKIIGEAVVTGAFVEAHIDPVRGHTLEQAVQERIITDVSLAFNAPPATPVPTDTNGHIRWVRNY